MDVVFSSQFFLGCGVGLGLWMVTYCVNRVWLGFWHIAS